MSDEQNTTIEEIGYRLATGRIDEDEARQRLVVAGLTPEEAEEFVDAVIEGRAANDN